MPANNLTVPEIGDKAPDFSLQDQSGNLISLKKFLGKPVILYFYPKDNTPGCTTEAIGFQEVLPKFEEAGVVVLGISPDDVKSHCKFIDKLGLGFSLLCDTENDVASKYGVWVEKNMYGKKYWGIQRSTFLIDKSGNIAFVWPKVKPLGHAADVLDKVCSL